MEKTVKGWVFITDDRARVRDGEVETRFVTLDGEEALMRRERSGFAHDYGQILRCEITYEIPTPKEKN